VRFFVRRFNRNLALTGCFRQWWQTNVDIKQLEEAYNNSGGQNITWIEHRLLMVSPAYWNNPYFERYKTTKMILEIVS
jgi:hypothetical protein